MSAWRVTRINIHNSPHRRDNTAIQLFKIILSARKFLTDTELAAARVTGALADGTPTQSARDSYRTQLAAAGKALMDMGLMPTDAQLEAMGWTKEQYRALRGA